MGTRDGRSPGASQPLRTHKSMEGTGTMNNSQISDTVFSMLDPLGFYKGASLAAIGLHLVLTQWSVQSLSDGFLPLFVVDHLGTDELFDELVAKELWTRSEDGFHIVGWHDEQEPATEVRATREAAADRVRRHRAKITRATLPDGETAVPDEEVFNRELEEQTLVRLAAATPTRSRKTKKVPEPELLPDDVNFDEYLDLMGTLPDDDRACWEAWVNVNRLCVAQDILDAADDYQMRVPRMSRMLPETWLTEHAYLKCSPFSDPWEPK